MGGILQENPLPKSEGIIHHGEGVDFMPASIELSGVEISLVNAMSRETILRQYMETVKPLYDFVLVDTSPSLGMLTINALAAANSVLIPVQAKYLPAKGLELLLKTIARVQRQINPKLSITGILLTMVDERTNDAREIIKTLTAAYGDKLPIFGKIPRSVRTSEITKLGKSIIPMTRMGKWRQHTKPPRGRCLQVPKVPKTAGALALVSYEAIFQTDDARMDSAREQVVEILRMQILPALTGWIGVEDW